MVELDQLVRERFFPDVTSGVFVDVGAARPDFLSMSVLYRELGWRVIAIEPNPLFCKAHRAAGYEVLEYACSDHDEDGADFEIVSSPFEGVTYESFSSLAVKPSYRALRAELDVTPIKVNVRRLDTILAEHAPDVGHVDLVSVDVEGWELEVLAGLDFERYRPGVLMIENLTAHPSYRRALRDRGYVLWKRRWPNEVYVSPARLSRRERALARLHALPVTFLFLRVAFPLRRWLRSLSRGGRG